MTLCLNNQIPVSYITYSANKTIQHLVLAVGFSAYDIWWDPKVAVPYPLTTLNTCIGYDLLYRIANMPWIIHMWQYFYGNETVNGIPLLSYTASSCP